jgi:hypothetical protein
MCIFSAYFGSFLCINAYIFMGLLGHKNPVNRDKTTCVGEQFAVVHNAHWDRTCVVQQFAVVHNAH